MENKKKKIIIIEDDKFLLKAYEIKFKQSDFDVILATDGISGFELAEKEKPSLIILDLMLPGMNGFEFLKKIKSDEKLKNIPIIVVSNLGQKNDCEKAIKLGAKEFLIKTNYSLEEIIKKIKGYL
ncbi:response regulator [Candidatus Parcubacteria bacterium]|nr:response regulator [Candidatus Parcubacteria bacterium]